MKKYVILTLIMIFSFFIQTTFMPRLKIWGVFPDFLCAVVVSISLLRGRWSGAFCGLSAGFFLDALFSLNPGMYTAQYAVVGFLAGFGGQVRIRRYKFLLPLALCFIVTAVKEMTWPIYAFFLNIEMSASIVILRILWRALYTTLTMLFAYQPLYILHKAEFMGVNQLFTEPADID